MTNEILSTSDVFNPGQFPQHTYRPRAHEEEEVKKWYRDRGQILVVHGPSKTGKTVLVQKLIDQYNPIWIDGHGLTSTHVLWSRIADALGLYTNVQQSTNIVDQIGVNLNVQAGFLGSHIATNPNYSESSGTEHGRSIERPIEAVAREALLNTDRPLVIDDIHFVPRDAQEELVKALKPLVFGSQTVKGRHVIFVSIGNRVMNVITNLIDMRGRMKPLPVEYWQENELEQIASDGFSKLKLTDPGKNLAKQLAQQSFGSPQLMQQMCRELCSTDPNYITHEQNFPFELNSPSSWNDFFHRQLLDDMAGWVRKLAKGPEVRGSERKVVTLKDGRKVHGYQLVLVAAASTGPKLKLTKNELRLAINEVSAPREDNKAHSVPTQILNNMTLIAATKLLDKIPSLEQLRREKEQGFDPYAKADLQPVMEYTDKGPTSELIITDPFFAYYLAWGLGEVLAESDIPCVDADETEDDWDQ